jgi:hypothetical protein
MDEQERVWPETLIAASKLQDGWCGEGSLAFSPRQLILACTLLAIGEVYGLEAEVFLRPPAIVQVVITGLSPTRYGIEITKASDDKQFMPDAWPDILHDWAETCLRLSTEEG